MQISPIFLITIKVGTDCLGHSKKEDLGDIMNYTNIDIVFQEVPGEISLAFSISGCSLRCSGCHSPELWKESNGYALSENGFRKILDKYQKLASCVLFFGGEWHSDELVKFLHIARLHGYKTCLYTGMDTVSDEISIHLDYLKTGAWIKEFGGLESEKTNQRFMDVKNKIILK